MLLRIGRQVQGQVFWERLITDERLRNTISREHCQIRATGAVAGEARFTLKNMSPIGTVINGIAVHHDTPLRANDVIGLGSNHPPGAAAPTAGGEVRPVVQFRLRAATTVANAGLDVVPEEGLPKSTSTSSALCCLECISAAGRHASELKGLAEAERVLHAPGHGQSLRIGRSIQPKQFWDKLIPDEGARNRVSREHFEVKFSSSSGEATLVNISGAGTLVNGVRVRDQRALRNGDVVALPCSPGDRPEDDGPPVASFRFQGPSAATTAAPAVAASTAVAGDVPAFQLSCIAVAGRHLGEIMSLAESGRILNSSAGLLRIGRSHQLAFWEALIPDASARNKVSREHFEVRAAAIPNGCIELHNRASSGTLVNGVRVFDKASLKPGAIIGVPSTATAAGTAEIEPVVSFEFQGPEAPGTSSGDWSTRAGVTIGNSGTVAESPAVLTPVSPALPPSAVVVKPRDQEQVAPASYGSAAPGGYGYAPTSSYESAFSFAQPPSAVVVPPTTPAQPSSSPSGYYTSQAPASMGTLPSLLPVEPAVSHGTGPRPAQAGPPPELAYRGPPTFELQCISALGLSAADLGFLPKEIRIWQPSPGEVNLRVGRAVQPENLWRAIMPDERLRNSIGREQFEITVEQSTTSTGPVHYLNNLGSIPTQVNDQHVHDRIRLEPMDVIGIGASLADKSIPAARFRFAMESSGLLASASALPMR